MTKQTLILCALALASCRNPKENETPEQRLRDYPKKDTVKGALYANESGYPRPTTAGVPFYQSPRIGNRTPRFCEVKDIDMTDTLN